MQASEDLQRASLGLYDDDTGPFPISGQQVETRPECCCPNAACFGATAMISSLHSMQSAVCTRSSVEVATSDGMQRQALERIGRARSTGLLQSATASEMGISAASFFFIVKVPVTT